MHHRTHRTYWIAGIAALFVALVLSVPVPGAAADSGPVIRSGSLEHDGLTRTYTLTVPDAVTSAEAGTVPLVIALHPFASSGAAMRARTGLDAQAAQHDFIVVYPDAADLHWDDGIIAAGLFDDLPAVDDIGFLGALIDHLAADYPVDPARVYLTGFERGGTMAYRAACAVPERFAGVAVVSALMWDYHAAACEAPAAPVSLLILHGDQNIEYPLDGRVVWDAEGNPAYHTGSLDDVITYWAARNECDLGAADVRFSEAGVNYLHCVAADSVLEVHVLHGVANNWPRVGDYTLNQFGIDASALVTQFFLGDGEPLTIDQPETVELVGGHPRSYRVYIPPEVDPNDTANPLPLVVALHGRPDSGAGMAYLSDFNRVARAEGFIVVYPDGIPVAPGQIIGREWNYTLGSPGSPSMVDDSLFLRRLADDLALDLAIDPDRRYVTGFSNGGFMTQRVACEDPEPWAAFASVGANLFPDFIALCGDKPPASMLIMHGSADASIPWDGKQLGVAVQFYNTPFTAGFWANHAGCMTEASGVEVVPSRSARPETQVYIYSFAGCDDGAEVLFYAIEGGGHNLPGIERLDQSIAGPLNMDIDAPHAIWDFFSRHARNAAPQAPDTP